jgi:hypothetical protein
MTLFMTACLNIKCFECNTLYEDSGSGLGMTMYMCPKCNHIIGVRDVIIPMPEPKPKKQRKAK